MSKVSYRAPFDSQGNLIHYPFPYKSYCYDPGDVDWREVVPFPALMTLDTGVASGRSAKYVYWSDEEGRRYPMFVVDIVGLITSGTTIENGRVDGLWVVCKRGKNYGIKFYGKA